MGLDRDPTGPALQEPRTSLRWQELEQQVERLVGVYAGLPLQQGERVASLMPNRLGLVITPLDYRYGCRRWTMP